MSHHSRWPLPGPGLGPNPGRNLLTDRRHMSPGCHVSSSSSSGGGSSHDGALKLLSSCGLSPADLALLAELPEDVLTVESLPHVLRQLKGQSGTVQAFPPDVSASSSYPHSCMWRPPGGPAPRDPQKPFSQLLHFRADQVKPSPLLPDQNRRGSLQSPSYAADHRFGPGFRERGLAGPAGPAAGPGPAQGGRKRIWTPGLPNLDYRPAPPPEVYHHERLHQGAPPSSRVQSASATPSSKEALDFHGTPPLAFPYSCALCDITVMSERVWAAHVNTPHHADGQLRLLQRFPNWDCRMEPVSRVDNQSGTGAEPRRAQAANQSSAALTNQKMKKKASEKSKVVCVKFPAASLDESHLRKLTEPFGRIVKILMFSSLAFVELGSVDQAKDLVKLYENQPVTVNGQQVEFKMSHTFSFLQSSLVVSFSPAPSGEDGPSDLLSIVGRFGTPLYTLFLPSKAFVEMKESLEAQKLVHYYSSNTLRINEDVIKVSFSGEYKTLMRVTSAKRYQEESRSLKRSLSGEKDRTEEAKRGRGNSRTPSRSSEKSTKERTARSRSTDRSAQEPEVASSDKSSKDGGSRFGSREVPSEEKSSRSKSTDKGSWLSPSRTRSKSREKLPDETNNTVTSRDEGDGERFWPRETSCSNGPSKEEPRPRTTESKPRCAENQRSRDPASSLSREARSQPEPEPEPDSASCDEFQSEESDIEGMEVIGEDGQSLEDEDTETLDEAGREEEEEEGAAETAELSEEGTNSMNSRPSVSHPAEREPDEEQRDERTGEDQEAILEEEKTETPLEEDKGDLDSCITLDKLEEEQPDRSSSQGSGEATFEDIRDPPQKNTRKDPNRSDTVSGAGLVRTTDEKEACELQSPGVEGSAEQSSRARNRASTETGPRAEADLESARGGVEGQQKCEPAGGAAEPQSPNQPIGLEFVRPVVGYFCNLCQQIYADEDEAKVVHCSTAAHYRKYQEKTGKDPRTNWT